jgi:hypothetical protein
MPRPLSHLGTSACTKQRVGFEPTIRERGFAKVDTGDEGLK